MRSLGGHDGSASGPFSTMVVLCSDRQVVGQVFHEFIIILLLPWGRFFLTGGLVDKIFMSFFLFFFRGDAFS